MGKDNENQRLRRLCIFVIYDKDGIVFDYIGILIRGIKSYLAKLIVVCNFINCNYGIENLDSADEILYRGNNGFDAGAVKDCITYLYATGEIYIYDELVILNDSFYGPFFSMDCIFKKMNNSGCHYWGLTRHLGGSLEDGTIIGEHIESYFIVFKTEIIRSGFLSLFFERLCYPKTLREAILHYEVGLNQYLNKMGYVGCAYSDHSCVDVIQKLGEVPYMLYPLMLVKDARCPFLKRNAFDFDNKGFKDVIGVLEYVEKYCNYNVELITSHLRNRPITRKISFDISDLENFYKKHKNIYIYGNGIWGKNLMRYFKYMGWKYKDVITSDSHGEAESITIDVVSKDSDTGIIVATGNPLFIREIKEVCQKYFSSDQILCPA